MLRHLYDNRFSTHYSGFIVRTALLDHFPRAFWKALEQNYGNAPCIDNSQFFSRSPWEKWFTKKDKVQIIGTYSYGMMMLSDDLRLFKTPNSKLALLSANIPQNQDKFEVSFFFFRLLKLIYSLQRFARNVALLNCVSFVTLTVDIYLNFFRKREKSSLAISYQVSWSKILIVLKMSKIGRWMF